MAPMLSKRQFLMLSVALSMSTVARAQPFPSRPIRILVGFSAGGGADALARIYALELQKVLNTPVIVDNKPGALQMLAIRPLMASQPDGYTLFLGAGSALASGPGVMKDLPYDPLKDFSHIARIAMAPGVFFVNPQLPMRTMAELISYAKANPGQLNYGSAGVGASNHLQMEYLKKAAGVELTHIPFKSDQDVAREVASGTVQFALAVAQAAVPLSVAGKLRPLAVTGSKRLPDLPQVPSLAEAGVAELKDIDSYTFYGLVGPAGMPPDIVQKINDATNQVSRTAAVEDRLRQRMYLDPVAESPEAFKKYLEREIPKWKELGKSIHL